MFRGDISPDGLMSSPPPSPVQIDAFKRANPDINCIVVGCLAEEIVGEEEEVATTAGRNRGGGGDQEGLMLLRTSRLIRSSWLGLMKSYSFGC